MEYLGSVHHRWWTLSPAIDAITHRRRKSCKVSQTGRLLWDGEEDNRFLVKTRGSFDSHKVHDPCLMAYRGKYYLYYKGEPMGERMVFGGHETRWGVAIADRPEGPYVRSPHNPATNSGHEVCVWPYRGGNRSADHHRRSGKEHPAVGA